MIVSAHQCFPKAPRCPCSLVLHPIHKGRKEGTPTTTLKRARYQVSGCKTRLAATRMHSCSPRSTVFTRLAVQIR